MLAVCRRTAVAATLLGAAMQSSVQAGDQLPGPVHAHVVRVVDGDTIDVDAHIWLGQVVHTRVRIGGVDAPELRGRCDLERKLAVEARDAVASHLVGKRVRLWDLDHDKYGGRVVARVTWGSGNDLGQWLMERGLARRYDGSTRPMWCELASGAAPP